MRLFKSEVAMVLLPMKKVEEIYKFYEDVVGEGFKFEGPPSGGDGKSQSFFIL